MLQNRVTFTNDGAVRGQLIAREPMVDRQFQAAAETKQPLEQWEILSSSPEIARERVLAIKMMDQA